MAVSAPTRLGSFVSDGLVATSGPIALTGPAAVGDVLVVSIAAGSASATLAVSDSGSNTWVEVATETTTGAAAGTSALYYTVLTTALDTSDTVTVTRSPSGGLLAGVDLLTGVDTTNPVGDHQVGSTAAADAALSTADLTVTAGATAILLGQYSSPRTITPADGWTLDWEDASTGAGNPRTGSLSHQQITTGGTVTPSGTLSSGVNWSAISASFTAATTPDSNSGTASGTASYTGAATGTTSREGAAATGTAATVAIIGDSLTERVENHAAPPTRQAATTALLEQAGWTDSNIYWYGKGGKKMTAPDQIGQVTTTDNIPAARTQLGTVNQWVIGLGTNDAAEDDATFETNMGAVLDAIYTTGTETDQVYWVALVAQNAANTTYNHLNSVIQDTLAARPEADRLHYIDLYTYLHSDGVYEDSDWLPSDVPHMTTAGYVKRDTYIISQLAKPTGGFNWAGTAAGEAPAISSNSGTATATLTLTATAAGSRDSNGVAAAGYSLTGTAHGSTLTSGHSAGNIHLAAAAAGHAAYHGAATSQLALTGAATGSSRPRRDITVTATLITNRWTATLTETPMRTDSLEYVAATITSPDDISDDLIEMSFDDGTTWHTATHLDDTRWGVLCGPGAITLTDGINAALVRITDNPEIPVIPAGSFHVGS